MAHQVLSHISHVGAEHNSWLRGIEFYNDELRIMKHRLEEVSTKNTNQDVKKNVEHYQNQFMVQETNLNHLKHDINNHLKHIENDVEVHAQHLSNHTIAEHDVMRDKYITLEKIINDMRHDFNRFLSKNM
jgi:glutaredoxin 2